MTSIDFDFGRYIAARRGEIHQRARDGAAYSYAGERKFRRTLQSARPVLLALDVAAKTWRKRGKADLLEHSVRATDETFPSVFEAAKAAAHALAVEPTSVYVSTGSLAESARALGTDDDAFIFLDEAIVHTLGRDELIAVIGHELAHVQNNHILYTTALYYLQHSAGLFVRWAIKPATLALQAWSRRAEITCDRAALLCVREEAVALRGLIRSALPSATDEQVAKLLEDTEISSRGISRFADMFRSHPYVPTRIAALRLFAKSSFYRRVAGLGDDGPTAEAIDEEISEMVSVF